MPRIIYIHVPKCGGSSFGAALRLRYVTSQATIRLGGGDPTLQGDVRILSDYARRRDDLRDCIAAGKRMIAGHVQYDPDLHDGAASGYRFVTLLRDPVDRFVSHYHYVQRKHPNPERADTLAAFLKTQDARRLASQYLFYFAGKSQKAAPETAPLVARAIANLSRFDIVGDLGKPHVFARDLRRLTGLPLLRWYRNAAPIPTRVPASLRSEIEALCAPDIAIYQSRFPIRAAA